jgi:hypothetical protein
MHNKRKFQILDSSFNKNYLSKSMNELWVSINYANELYLFIAIVYHTLGLCNNNIGD